METKQQKNVMIKGTKDGLTFFLNDQCTFDALTSELEEMLSEQACHVSDKQGEVKVKIVLGKRYLLDHQLEKIKEILYEKIYGVVDIIDSDIVTKEEALHIFKAKSVHRIAKVVRSGQVLECEGDLLLIGDVNPGATVIAKGNIYILGKLLGSAHAGSEGNENAMVFASLLQPTQLKISGTLWDIPEENGDVSKWLGCAFLNENGKIEIEDLSKVMMKHPSLFYLLNEYV